MVIGEQPIIAPGAYKMTLVINLAPEFLLAFGGVIYLLVLAELIAGKWTQLAIACAFFAGAIMLGFGS